MQKMRNVFSTEEVAKCLCKLAGKPTDGNLCEDAENALYSLMCTAQNKYNSEFYRSMWNLLQSVAYHHEKLIYDD